MNPKKGYGENETGVFKREVLNGNLQREKLKEGDRVQPTIFHEVMYVVGAISTD